MSTGPELHHRQSRPSYLRVHSQRVTSCRNPALVVAVGELGGAGIVRVGDRAQQDDQLTGAAAGAVGHVVLNNPDQVRLLRVEVLPVGGRCHDLVAAGGGPDLGVDEHAQIGPVGQGLCHWQAQLGRGPPQQRRTRVRSRGPGTDTVEVTSAVNSSSGFRRGYSRLARVFSPTVYASTSAARNAWV